MRGHVFPLERCQPRSGDILVYHFGLASELTDFIIKRGGFKLVLIYHNLTPPHYFKYEDPLLAQSLQAGKDQLAQLKGFVDLAIADSNYSARELSAIGYLNVAVVPPVYLDDKYEIPPDKATLERFAEEKINLLFVSRIAPNKKQEDVIKVFYYYRGINPASRLLLVGPLGVTKVYYRWLLDLVDYLGLPDVHFTDRVSQGELNAYYRLADVFISMSEHEGFGIFLVESMYFDVPIVAYKSTAVPETLGQAGVLVREKDFPVIAEVIDLLVSDRGFRKAILETQRQRLQDFAKEKLESRFWEQLNPLLER
jgi:glycosyltransferase involved in cell wall biosynthesis